jgi:hypothetical protein
VAHAILDRLLERIRRAAPDAYDGGVLDEVTQLGRSLWGCEAGSFEVVWAEVVALLKTVSSARSQTDWSEPAVKENDENRLCLYRLPHALHVVHGQGLELHNLDQLTLEGPGVSKQEGSAAHIQQVETFDGAVVTDHPDRAKSSRFMKALTEQVPYWRSLVGAGTNLNWGELHLYLAATKLKEGGVCVYLSHRVLPEGGDGDRLRRAILGLAQLECFAELAEESSRPYRYVYVFRRCSNKAARDGHRPRFGKLRDENAVLRLADLEEATSQQAEILERGWDHLFVRGAAPLVRHLNHKFPKLFQLATVQAWAPGDAAGQALFSSSKASALSALEVVPEGTSEAMSSLRFTPAAPSGKPDRVLVFPHNPVDLPWIESLLNSAPAQFWIRNTILSSGKNPRLTDLRSCPIVDLSHAPSDLIHAALEWMGETKPSPAALTAWACRADAPLIERYANYVALAKRSASLERVVARYRGLFTTSALEELKPDAVTQFYPAPLLVPLAQSPEIRIHYADRTRSPLSPESWSLLEVDTVMGPAGGRTMVYVVVRTRQGPSIQILAPATARDYLVSQLRALVDRTWGEALAVTRFPRDLALFAAQTTEITRVVADTAQAQLSCRKALDALALDLFEIAPEVRQFLPQH